MKTQQTQRADIYQTVTDKIIKALEDGTMLPWQRPWHVEQFNESGLPENFATKRPYSGVNIVLLWIAAMERGFQDERWLTYKQAQEIGLQVPQGAVGEHVVYFSRFEKTDKVTGDKTGEFIPFLKTYTVFNIETLIVAETGDGYQRPEAPKYEWNDSAASKRLNALLDSHGAQLTHKGHHAKYVPTTDEIYLPPKNSFKKLGGYMAVKAHEFIHWTGHASRLDRLAKVEKEGRPARALEELVAEIGSAFLCHRFKVNPDGFQHESYVKTWLEALHNDKRLVFTASAMAQRANEFLLRTHADEEQLAA